MKKPRINDFDPHAPSIPDLSSSMENLPTIEQPKRTVITENDTSNETPQEPVSNSIDTDTNVIPRYHDTMQPRHHATTDSHLNKDLTEVVRKAVKHVGKEAATHRFTFEEKQVLSDIEYQYRRQGIRTSENEITRIAINYFAEEYKQNGEHSLLAKILKKINS